MSTYKKSQYGYTLTEVTIVLGIVGLILGGVWTAAASVYQANSIRTASESIVKITQNIRMLYAERSRFSSTTSNGTDITSMLKNAKVFPSNIVDPSNGDPLTPWETKIRVIVDTPTSFEVVLDQTMPGEECYRLSMMMIGPGREPALIGVTQNGAVLGAVETLNASDLIECSRASYVFKLN